jgi:uncharacterized protein
MTSFQAIQETFVRHLRDPLHNPMPLDIEPRRMRIYQELIYNNIESFIANGFPILRHLTTDVRWHAMVRDFISRHASQSPYFCEIGQEFLAYLQNERQEENDPPYLLELAHFEQVELALEISEPSSEGEGALENQGLPTKPSLSTLLCATLMRSPLAYLFVYRYPVHRFSVGEVSDQPSTYYLLIYRDRAFKVVCMEISAVTARMISIFEQQPGISVQTVLKMISRELSISDVSDSQVDGQLGAHELDDPCRTEANAAFFAQAHHCLLDLIDRGVLLVHG